MRDAPSSFRFFFTSTAFLIFFPNRILIYIPLVETTTNNADIVENQPTPIFSIAGRQTALPRAAKEVADDVVTA
jgi:hypothetical protein